MKRLPKHRSEFSSEQNMRTVHLGTLLASLSLMFLASCGLWSPKSEVTDSFCTVYKPLIQAKGDSNIKAPKPVLDRMATNEKTYQEFCVSHTP
jgi:hypothetical protein